MKNVKVMVIAGDGINCEIETAEAFLKVGAQVDIISIRDWKNRPNLIRDYQILAIPGGFSYGDELHSGQIMALELKHSLGEELKQFITKKGLIIGVCNGFQILMKLGVFEADLENRKLTLYHNDSFKFQDRWVSCEVKESKCVWTKGLKALNLPVRHGEGRIIIKGAAEEQKNIFENLINGKQVALVYTEDINGSYERIAGLTDTTGQIFGLMPHPEAALEDFLYPSEFAQDLKLPLKIFENAFDFAKENLC